MQIPSGIGYNATTRTAMLNPNANLARGMRYTATVTGIKDSAGNAIVPVS